MAWANLFARVRSENNAGKLPLAHATCRSVRRTTLKYPNRISKPLPTNENNATFTVPGIRFARLLGYSLRTNDKWIVV